jgi:hypothetical protein
MYALPQQTMAGALDDVEKAFCCKRRICRTIN